MGRKKQLWRVGDVFTIELSDGAFAVGQIVGHEPDALNSASIALFDYRVSEPTQALDKERSVSRAFAVLFCTRDLLDSGKWRIVGNGQVEIPSHMLPYERTRKDRFVGARIIGSAIIKKFAEAYFELAPWHSYKDPAYLDALLINKDKKPASAR